MRLKTKILCLLALLTTAPVVQADWTVYNHSTATITEGAAYCLLAPTTLGTSLVISRLRLTRSGTSDVTHRFAFKLTKDVRGDTEDLTSCDASPTCSYILTAEGTKEGRVYNMSGLNLVLPPGARFYVMEDAHQAGEYLTLEVFYTER